ncbi:MAG: phosphomannomutase/phosphoglucomutase, partial [Bacilli bacterium]|nr:phosphomannomutase/phosphoglucomutase [Bacilli bacterium]
FKVIDQIKEILQHKKIPFKDIYGVRIEKDEFWVLVRASNTTPNLTVRFEANSEELLEKIKEEYFELINKVIKG